MCGKSLPSSYFKKAYTSQIIFYIHFAIPNLVLRRLFIVLNPNVIENVCTEEIKLPSSIVGLCWDINLDVFKFPFAGSKKRETRIFGFF